MAAENFEKEHPARGARAREAAIEAQKDNENLTTDYLLDQKRDSFIAYTSVFVVTQFCIHHSIVFITSIIEMMAAEIRTKFVDLPQSTKDGIWALAQNQISTVASPAMIMCKLHPKLVSCYPQILVQMILEKVHSKYG